MLQQKNVTHMTVLKDGGAMVADGILVNDYTDFINDGDIAILDVNNVAHDHNSVGTVTKFRIARRYGTRILYSPFITTANITEFKGTAAVASAEQIDYIGYNGTTGTIDEIDDNVYKINLDIQKAFGTNPPKQMLKHGVYKSGSAATQAQIAAGLVQNLIDNFSRDKIFNHEEGIMFERVNSGTSIATSAGAFAVVNGSVTVTVPESAGGANDAGKYNADAATMVVGDYIRFGHATTKTFPVYKIAAITGEGTAACTITLDVPYQGATGSVAAANAGVIAIASIGDFGLKLTGRARTNFEPGRWKYYKVRWVATLVEDFGTTLLTNSQAATEGTGQWQQIAEDEWFYQGNEGSVYRVQVPNIPSRKLVEELATGYYQITLRDFDKTSSTIVGETKLPKAEVIAIATDDQANFITALQIATGLTIA